MENELHKLVEIEIVVRFLCVCVRMLLKLQTFFPAIYN